MENIIGFKPVYDVENYDDGKILELEKRDELLFHVDIEDDVKYYKYEKAFDFFKSKIGSSFGGFDNFQLKDLKTPNYPVLEKFIKPYLETEDELYVSENYKNIGVRRCGVGVEYDKNQEAWINNLKDGKKGMLLSQKSYNYGVSDIDKYAWQALLNMDEMENPSNPKIYVHVKISKIRPCRYNEVIEETKGVKTAITMLTK